jgi:hypothetical protein
MEQGICGCVAHGGSSQRRSCESPEYLWPTMALFGRGFGVNSVKFGGQKYDVVVISRGAAHHGIQADLKSTLAVTTKIDFSGSIRHHCERVSHRLIETIYRICGTC